MSWLDELGQRRLVVMLGAGGVGKTTSAMCVALALAKEGRKVGLLSIDPAKRLAEAIGIPLGSTLRRLDLGPDIHLEAAMLDQKAMFDEMVGRFAKSPAARNRIFGNGIYKQVSTNLGGPLEYVALAKVGAMLGEGDYDTIVLDTPPDTHALDFLVRPNVLSGFMDQKVMTWLVKPFHLAQKMGMGRIFSMSEKLMGGMAAVTGAKALQMLAEFLVMMEEVIVGFHHFGQTVMQTLKSQDTGFVLVTTPRAAACRSAYNIASKMQHEGFKLSALVGNRFPPPKSALIPPDGFEPSPALLSLLATAERSAVAADQSWDWVKNAVSEVHPESFAVQVPELHIEIQSQESLWQLTENFSGS